MVGVAVAVGFPFLDAFCPGYRQLKQVDLRKLDRHERTTLHGLISAAELPELSAVK